VFLGLLPREIILKRLMIELIKVLKMLTGQEASIVEILVGEPFRRNNMPQRCKLL
jgi:hypothetical protein